MKAILKPRTQSENSSAPLKIFQPRKPDLFDRTELETKDKILVDPELRAMIELVARRVVAEYTPPAVQSPPEIRETRVEVVKETSNAQLEKALAALEKSNKRIDDLEKKLAETDRMARSPIVVPGGSGVIGIPPPEAAPDGYVLTRNADGKAEWKASTGGSGAGLSGYTVSNGSELKTIDVTDITFDNLCRVVGTIIEELQS